MFNFLIYILCKSEIVGAGLIVIGAGLGIGKLVVQQWTLLLVSQKLLENPNSYDYRSLLLLKVLFRGFFCRIRSKKQ
jgi:hypothetical protein